MNDDRVETLANLVLVDDEGRKVRLGDAWKARAVILTFLRHYG